jgi:hypothetical protein
METTYTTAQAAGLLGIKPRMVARWCRRLNVAKFGRDYVITPADLARLRRRRTTPGPVPQTAAEQRQGEE